MILHLQNIDSTNAYAKREAARLAHGDAVIADMQTAGRGRMGRSFSSEEGGLYLTVMLRPNIILADSMLITGMAAVAAARAVEALSGTRPSVKWMNDLIMGGKKICGILTETALEGDRLAYAVVGIGVNVTRVDFPPELAGIAGSILTAAGTRVDKDELAAALIEGITKAAADLEEGNIADYLAEYRRDCVTVGAPSVMISEGGEIPVMPVSVDDRFRLIVRREDGTTAAVSSGEVSVKGRGI